MPLERDWVPNPVLVWPPPRPRSAGEGDSGRPRGLAPCVPDDPGARWAERIADWAGRGAVASRVVVSPPNVRFGGDTTTLDGPGPCVVGGTGRGGSLSGPPSQRRRRSAWRPTAGPGGSAPLPRRRSSTLTVVGWRPADGSKRGTGWSAVGPGDRPHAARSTALPEGAPAFVVAARPPGAVAARYPADSSERGTGCSVVAPHLASPRPGARAGSASGVSAVPSPASGRSTGASGWRWARPAVGGADPVSTTCRHLPASACDRE